MARITPLRANLGAWCFLPIFLAVVYTDSFAASAPAKIPPDIQRLRKQSRSRVVLRSDHQAIEVFLYAEDEQIEILRGSYCGGEEGDKQYSGDYWLISVSENNAIASVIQVGKRTFTEGRIDGVKKFPVPKSTEPLIAIYQYAGCNNNRVEFYRVDDQARLHRVIFRNRDGSKKLSLLCGSEPGDGDASDNQVTFCWYDNSSGKTFCDSYSYDGENLIQTKSSWHY